MKHLKYMHAGAMSGSAPGRLPIGFPAWGCIRDLNCGCCRALHTRLSRRLTLPAARPSTSVASSICALVTNYWNNLCYIVHINSQCRTLRTECSPRCLTCFVSRTCTDCDLNPVRLASLLRSSSDSASTSRINDILCHMYHRLPVPLHNSARYYSIAQS